MNVKRSKRKLRVGAICTHIDIEGGDNPSKVVHVSVGTVHRSKSRENGHQSDTHNTNPAEVICHVRCERIVSKISVKNYNLRSNLINDLSGI